MYHLASLITIGFLFDSVILRLSLDHSHGHAKVDSFKSISGYIALV